MKWLLAILFIIFGAILFSLTIYDIGTISKIIIKIIALGSFLIAGFIVKGRKKDKQSS
ncbi:hypothetical protein [Oceanobacillus chungangensis]|uniref:hypothetical protein n=1 Tax=Oceanobacillus chungangensis TaxID=1229152 RepID=UPI00147525C0|nr:hypothetical protein [Oceanobacillus chungangensis]